MIKEYIDLLKTLDPELFPDDLEQYVRKLMSKAKIITISTSLKLEGFIAYYANDIKGEKAFVSMIAVSKNHQGKGIGRGLLELVINLLKKEGYLFLELEVHYDNMNAQNLYSSLGFEIIGQDDRIHMRKVL